MHRSTLAAAIVAGAVLAAAATHASAQAWPSKAIRMIAPYPPGGGVDTVARALADGLAPRLGQPVTVENRPGAGATIGADALARSAPDGYTLMLGSMVDYSIAPHVHKKLTFDMAKDFVAIVDVAYGTIGMVIAPNVPANTIAELVALLKAKPGGYSYASSGTGGLIHLNGEMFKQLTGVDALHVPYKGTTQFQPDLLEGRVAYSLDNVLAHIPHVKSGKLKVLAVGSRQRSPLLPDVPTMIEAGVPGFESATNYTLFAPAGVPKEVVDRLNRESNAVLALADVRERLLKMGVVVTGGTVDAVQAQVRPEMARWAEVIRKGNIKVD